MLKKIWKKLRKGYSSPLVISILCPQHSKVFFLQSSFFLLRLPPSFFFFVWVFYFCPAFHSFSSIEKVSQRNHLYNLKHTSADLFFHQIHSLVLKKKRRLLQIRNIWFWIKSEIQKKCLWWKFGLEVQKKKKWIWVWRYSSRRGSTTS